MVHASRPLSRLALIALAGLALASFAACARKEAKPAEAPAAAAPKYKFGLVTGSAGLNDHAFNDMHYNGMMEAQKTFGIQFEYEVPPNEQDFAGPAEKLIAKGCNVIIAGAGFFMVDTVEELSQKHPDVFFILDDSAAKTYRSNVASITYRQNEGSFLAGALAAKVSAKKKVASLGAANVPVINDFMVGFKGGALYADPGVKVVEAYIADRLDPKGGETSAWAAPRTAKAMALEIYQAGADIVFQVAGGSGMGVFLAAQETGNYGIGVDSDQDYLVEGSILTSMMKNVDKGMVFIIGEMLAGRIKNQDYPLGLKEGGVGISPMTYTRGKVPAEAIAFLDGLRKDVAEGKVKIPSAF